MLQQIDIDSWKTIFIEGLKGRDNILNNINESKFEEIMKKRNKNYKYNEFLNGINLLYNDNVFKYYCQNIKNNEFEFSQLTIIKMQKQSQIISYFLTKMDEIDLSVLRVLQFVEGMFFYL